MWVNNRVHLAENTQSKSLLFFFPFEREKFTRFLFDLKVPVYVERHEHSRCVVIMYETVLVNEYPDLYAHTLTCALGQGEGISGAWQSRIERNNPVSSHPRYPRYISKKTMTTTRIPDPRLYATLKFEYRERVIRNSQLISLKRGHFNLYRWAISCIFFLRDVIWIQLEKLVWHN